MVKVTSVHLAAPFECLCLSSQQTQQCCQDGLLTFLIPFFSLIGVLFISLKYTEIIGTLRIILKCVFHHPSLVLLVSYERMAYSAAVSTARVVWKTIYTSTCTSFYIPQLIVRRIVRRFKENPLKNRCHKYQQQCERWIDYRILRINLIKNNPLLRHKLPHKCNGKISIECLWDYFNSMKNNGDGFETFISCLKVSLQTPSFFHLGHDSLVKLLTSETEYLLNSDDYICNSKIEEIICENTTQFIELVNVKELLPIMESKLLVTIHDEQELNLNFMTYTMKADHLLTVILPTKGHCGYILFLECLEDEHSHVGHCEIAKTIKTELIRHQISRPQKYSLNELQAWYHPRGLMNTQEYIEATDKFLYLSQSSDLKKFNKEIKVYTSSETPEVEAFGLMMKALSFKFLCKDSKFNDLNFQIKQCIYRIKDIDNLRNITGIWYSLSACWHRHKRDFRKARELLEKAKSELISGNNRAYILFNEASFLIENENTREDKKIITLLQDAIRGFHSRKDEMSIMQTRCYLTLSHCYIGSSLSCPRIARRSSSQLDKADSILTMLAKKFDALPLRLQMEYYAVLCDYHRVRNRKQQAIDCINKGLSLESGNKFKRDQQYLQDRL